MAPDSYVFGRGYRARTRWMRTVLNERPLGTLTLCTLELQHSAWRNTIGYLVYPHIDLG